MNVATEHPVAWQGFLRGFESGRLAHAYIVYGNPEKEAGAFATAAIKLLFGADEGSDLARRIDEERHSDVISLRPESKARMIRVAQIRELNKRIQQTTAEARYKVGIIEHADCMNPQASNAFLKTLEEPAGDTLLLLLTDAPEIMLPTIHSRCQRIVLSRREPELPEPWRSEVLDALRHFSGGDLFELFQTSEAIQGVLKSIREHVEESIERDDAEEKEVFEARVSAQLRQLRTQVFRVILCWQRDLLHCVLGAEDTGEFYFPEHSEDLRSIASSLTYAMVLRRIKAAEEMDNWLDRNLPPSIVLDGGLVGQLGRKRQAKTSA